MEMLDAAQRSNFTKLATYLERLPKDYAHFSMGMYFGLGNRAAADAAAIRQSPRECGAVACALGHGPAAGVPFQDDHVTHNRFKKPVVHWSLYARDSFFPSTHDVWYWVFHDNWVINQPDHRAAAARIWYLLDNDSPPPDWSFHDDIYTVY